MTYSGDCPQFLVETWLIWNFYINISLMLLWMEKTKSIAAVCLLEFCLLFIDWCILAFLFILMCMYKIATAVVCYFNYISCKLFIYVVLIYYQGGGRRTVIIIIILLFYAFNFVLLPVINMLALITINSQNSRQNCSWSILAYYTYAFWRNQYVFSFGQGIRL